MRFVVFGAGAVGGVIGGRLAQHGHEVVLIARGEHAAAIAARGLVLVSPDEELTLALPVVTGAGEIDWRDGDVVLLAVKSQQTDSALEQLAACAPADIQVVCAQNGVENERRALRRFSHVYAMTVLCPTGHLEPGVVEAYSSPVTGILDLGRYPRGVDDLAVSVASALSASTFLSDAVAEPMRRKWSKLLLNLNNAIEALCGGAARGGELSRLVRAEGIACLEAAGIDHATEAQDRARRGDLVRPRPIGERRRPGGSTWQSLARATGDVEVDFLNGEIVLLGRLHGVATPVNELLRRLVIEAARTGTAPGAWSEQDVLARL